jgi:DNA-directed RNA polymerase specialized sigma24 family protein/ribosome-associated translation inhibitor RaiA
MNVQISYKVDKTPQIEKEISHLLDKLGKRLQVFRPELVHLKGLVEESSAPRQTAVSLNLRLPSGQMAAQQSAFTPAAAVKAAFDDLLQQVTKHKDLLRNPRKWLRRRSANDRSERVVPFEETLAAVQPARVSADDIRSYVNVNLKRLELFVERELYFREAAEQVGPGLVTKEEVVDEAVARALGEGGEKPERLALEAWFYRLALRDMNDLASGAAENRSIVHLEESARRPNVRASDEPQLQFHQPDETLTKENVIADRRTATPEDIASSDEMITLVHSALSRASRSDREAFILHVVEGFSVEEVVAITGHDAERVQCSIASARACLRQTPSLAGRFRGFPPTGTA